MSDGLKYAIAFGLWATFMFHAVQWANDYKWVDKVFFSNDKNMTR